MNWAFQIAEIFGISIRVHLVFVLLLLFIGWTNAAVGGTAAGLEAMAYFLVIFVFVLLHELGHSVAARRFGVTVRDIVLLPIGGVARMERLPQKPLQEIIIAMAGPAVNFAAVGLVLLLMSVFGHPLQKPTLYVRELDVPNSIFALNLFMGTFNLVPAFPMDGGRVLRGVLALRLSYARATHLASRLGQIMAVIFGIAGVLYFQNIWLVVIAVFVFVGAGSERQMVHLPEPPAGLTVDHAMSRALHPLHPDEPLRRLLAPGYQDCQDDFPVLEGERLVGMLPRHRALAALQQGGLETPVRDFMNTRFVAVRPQANLAYVHEQMAAHNLRAVPVVENERIVGMLHLAGANRPPHEDST